MPSVELQFQVCDTLFASLSYAPWDFAGSLPSGSLEQDQPLLSVSAPQYSCQLCNYKTKRKTHMDKHLRIHTGERPFKCHLCPNTFTQKWHLKQHLRSHTGERPHQCHLCQETFTQRSHLIRHLRNHTGERPFPCVHCGASFAQRENLLRHMSHHVKKEPRYGKVTHSRTPEEQRELDEWRREQQQRLGRTQRFLPKAIHAQLGRLKSSADTMSDERNGSVNIHNGLGRQTDSLAALFLTAAQSLVPLVLSDVALLLHKVCDALFVLPSRPPCDYTDSLPSGFPAPYHSLGPLEQYRSLVDVYGWMLSCRLCPYKTENRTTMKSHLRTHTGERPFKCHLCPSDFTHNWHLKEHVRTHTGERPYRCHLCPEAFTQSVHLTRHVRCHTGQRRFPCVHCSASFTREDHLKNHMTCHAEKKT
ncbi:zinc finger protein 528-like [Dermacentor silvarum]|uniref:zinc finger protein 528-like n=1 Tax=Dermacentor silvarum TaxID=543639 RepID=UPI0021019070|nr:zinc finger protein 528-like [Dermacentor silvarum]